MTAKRQYFEGNQATESAAVDQRRQRWFRGLPVIDGTITTQRYINEVLRSACVPLFAAHRDVTKFQQDNAGPQSVLLTTAFVREQGINTLPCTAISI